MVAEDSEPEDVVQVPLRDELDLHTFAPRDVPDLVRHYLDESVERGFRRVRLIHGKGTGALRQTVAGILRRHAAVASFETAGEDAGGWGATIVELKPKDPTQVL
jgi:dsDNA-specific endonuclease/ATPase MutS2